MLLLALLATSRAHGAEARQEGRWWAFFDDGTLLAAEQSEDGAWWEEGARLAGRALFDAHHPVRLLYDSRRGTEAPAACVLLAGGDVLPGRVEAFLPADPEENLPERLAVALEHPLQAAGGGRAWVRADRVVSIRWPSDGCGSAPPSIVPGTLGLADGRTLNAAAVRFAAQGLSALTDQGIVEVPFDGLARVDLPRVDLLGALAEDAGYPPLGPPGLIGRLTTTRGAVFTWDRRLTWLAVRDMDRKRHRGESEPVLCLHLQPSWALTVVLVPVDEVCRASFRRPDEVPLSCLPAETLHQRGLLHTWPWQRNASVDGSLLSSGRILADLGIGVHADTRVAFSLPPGAAGFSAWVGLHTGVPRQAAAACALRAEGPDGNRMLASARVRAGQEPVRIGPVDLGGARRLVLESLAADVPAANAPRGDVPPGDAPLLDIGTQVDWLWPVVRVETRPEPARAIAQFVPGWGPWELSEADAQRLVVEPRFEVSQSAWRPVLRLGGKEPLSVRRHVPLVTWANDLLEVVVSPPEESVAERLELLADGQPAPRVAEVYRYGHYGGHSPRKEWPVLSLSPELWAVKLRWDLQAWRDRAVDLELRLAPAEKQPIVWHGCRLRSAIANLRESGRPLMPDVALTAIEPLEIKANREKQPPTPDGVPHPGNKDRPITFLGQPHRLGYGMRRGGAVSFAVKPEYRRFVAVVGCCGADSGPVEVLLDEKVVWRVAEMEEDQPAVQISLDIPAGTRRLTLRLGDEATYRAAVGFAYAGFVTGQ